ncbi:transmembrane protein 252-like [Mugil cephalus]|uniref:transmembrane protein 252-like n=1 Tax=Mugil cephalus TaxID=48193 RepID=UPI001FB5EE28|nr:transmembrane protein 252-like [Mugil cephalus]
MTTKKRLWSLARMVLPGVGFALTCIGAYLVSRQKDFKHPLTLIPVYIVIVFGFIFMMLGVFWTICHSMKSKVYQRSRQPERHMQIFTVERPRNSPPSYQESQASQVCPGTPPEFVVAVDGVDVVVGLAPPLYSQDSSEAPDCTWSWEQPPRYSQVERIQPGQLHAGDRREVVSSL